ncbi:Endonuclease/exonuclease/phosphatase [Trema orientale]|uniref:Endonuclease/exonuclease/phosphatase n=1 Tax=Trema orientale TaxID=63057 RepID=A0A2P5A9R4_TREOI|nr:Endonuclease/exonuclease/phosphatase [Trema orientale]
MEGLDGKDYMLYGPWLRAHCDIPNCFTKESSSQTESTSTHNPSHYLNHKIIIPEPTPREGRSSELQIVGSNVFKSSRHFVPATIRPFPALPSPQTPPLSPETSLARKPDQNSDSVSNSLAREPQPAPLLLHSDPAPATKTKTHTLTTTSPNTVPTVLTLHDLDKSLITLACERDLIATTSASLAGLNNLSNLANPKPVVPTQKAANSESLNITIQIANSTHTPITQYLPIRKRKPITQSPLTHISKKAHHLNLSDLNIEPTPKQGDSADPKHHQLSPSRALPTNCPSVIILSGSSRSLTTNLFSPNQACILDFEDQFPHFCHGLSPSPHHTSQTPPRFYSSWKKRARNQLTCGGCQSASTGAMIALAWNYRGLASRSTVLDLKALLSSFSPDLLILSETKIPTSKLSTCLNSLHFYNLVHVPPVGLSGGLCIAWKNGLDFEPTLMTKNVISGLIYFDPPSHLWLLSAVYGPPHNSDRDAFWNKLGSVTSMFNCSWLLIGDFNGTLFSYDRLGGNHIGSSSSSAAFRFNNASLKALPACSSDHYPFILNTMGVGNFLKHPFRFEAIWTRNPRSTLIVKHAWSELYPFPSAVTLCRKIAKTGIALTNWNKTQSGKLKQNMAAIRSAIAYLQNSVRTPENMEKEKNLRWALTEQLIREEIHWK